MSKPKVLITRNFFDQAIDLIKTVAEVEIYPSEDDPIPRDILLDKVQHVEGLLPMLTDRIDQELLDKGKNLKVVSNYAVGYNNINVPEATKHGVMISNTPDVLTDTTADCAFMLLMAISRRLVEVDKYVRDGKWIKAWGPKMLLGSDITGKTLGIIGLGRIGKAIVPRANGFKMKILYHDNFRNPKAEKEQGVEFRSFDDILTESDYISLHVPLNDETKHLIGEPELRKMKKTAYLINTARGQLIDEKALIKALKEKWIAGAGVDVHYKEPTDSDNQLLELDNIIVSPHIASATIETRLAMAMKAATNLTAALKGERPPDLLNPEVLE
ncbi:2-hydroxyacid dehydrogenase [Thermoproteota archaeon]